MTADGSSEKVLQSQKRFLRSEMGRPLSEEECREKGRVVLTEMNGVRDTLGSQLLITVAEGKDKSLDGFTPSSKNYSADSRGRPLFRSLGIVSEDENNIRLDAICLYYGIKTVFSIKFAVPNLLKFPCLVNVQEKCQPRSENLQAAYRRNIFQLPLGKAGLVAFSVKSAKTEV